MIRFVALVLALCAFASPAAAQGYSAGARAVIQRAYAASGGAGWLLLRGWRETGTDGAAAYERSIDPVRYGLRVERRDAQGLSIRGFNGQAVWHVAPTGIMTAVNDHPTLEEARAEAFFAAGAYYFPGRFGAKGDDLGVRSHGGRSFQVVRVTPWNGESRELWFDPRTHLLARIVERRGAKIVAYAVSDYRKVGPVRVPFRYAPEPGTPGAVRQIASLAFTPADRGLFSLDRPAALAQVRAAGEP